MLGNLLADVAIVRHALPSSPCVFFSKRKSIYLVSMEVQPAAVAKLIDIFIYIKNLVEEKLYVLIGGLTLATSLNRFLRRNYRETIQLFIEF